MRTLKAPNEGDLQGEEGLALLLQQAAGGEPIFKDVNDLKSPEEIDKAVRRAVNKIRPKEYQLWESFYELQPENARYIESTYWNEYSFKGPAVGIDDFFAEWLLQRMLFLEMGKILKLERTDQFKPDQPGCAFVLTRSSSIYIVGEKQPDDKRRPIDYVRIDSRKPSWHDPTSFRSEIGCLKVGERGDFKEHSKSSPVQYILVLPADRKAERQEIQTTISYTKRSVEGVMAEEN